MSAGVKCPDCGAPLELVVSGDLELHWECTSCWFVGRFDSVPESACDAGQVSCALCPLHGTDECHVIKKF